MVGLLRGLKFAKCYHCVLPFGSFHAITFSNNINLLFFFLQLLQTECINFGMKLSRDVLDKNVFRNVLIQEQMPRDLDSLSDHFQAAISNAQEHFFNHLSPALVHNPNGKVVKCDVEFTGSGQHRKATVYPEDDDRVIRDYDVNYGVYHSFFLL
jgi:hypothetical protein